MQYHKHQVSMLCISGCAMATNMGQTPTVRWILHLKLKHFWSETGWHSLHTDCHIPTIQIDGKSLLRP